MTKLKLRDHSFGDRSATGIASHLRAMHALKELDLSGNYIRAAGARAIAAHLGVMRVLQELHLGGNRIGAQGATAIAPHLGTLRALQKLDLRENAIGDDGVRTLALHLGAMRALEELILRDNHICAAGARAVAPHLPVIALTKLDLSHNAILDDGVLGLAPHLPPTLRALNLSHNGVGAAGAQALALHLPPALQGMNLNVNRIGDAGACALAPRLPPTLRTLCLVDNALGVQGARAIAQHLPEELYATSDWELHTNGNDLVEVQSHIVLDYARAARHWTALHRAVDARDGVRVCRLLRDGADPRLRGTPNGPPKSHAEQFSALSLSASAKYSLALPVDAEVVSVLKAALKVRWSRVTHLQCPRDVRVAAHARALLLGGRGLPVMNADVWGVIFTFLTDGEHERRPLQLAGVIGACCRDREGGPCAACCRELYADALYAGASAAPTRRSTKRKRGRGVGGTRRRT